MMCYNALQRSNDPMLWRDLESCHPHRRITNSTGACVKRGSVREARERE
jgi:hypothetical protein